jgi:hypothetical protein
MKSRDEEEKKSMKENIEKTRSIEEKQERKRAEK